jgi:inner membrane protein
MATIYTHAAVGVGLGYAFARKRLPPLFWALAALLPVVPDFDVFSNASYGAMLGHRGFTHSLCFALAVGLVVSALTFRYFRVNFWDLLGFFFVVTASHGILDAFTNGGYGIPFFWPFDQHRFGPWGPIQVQDIGFQFPDPWTSRSVRTELLYVWLPMAVAIGAIAAYRRYRRLLTPAASQEPRQQK